MKTKINFSIVVIVLMFLFGCNESNKKIHDNEAVAKAFIDAWTSHDADKLTSLFAEDCLYEEVARSLKYTNKKEIAEYVNGVISGVPDTDLEIVSVIVSESMAMAEWIWKGTNTVGWPSMGIPATNKYFECRGTSVMEIENGLVKRNSDYWDWQSFLTSIGVE